MSTLEQISENLIKGKANEVKELVQKALDEGLDAGEVLNNGLLAGMGVVGERFKKNEVYVPEVLIAARAMKAGTEILKPLLGLLRERITDILHHDPDDLAHLIMRNWWRKKSRPLNHKPK